MSGASRPAGRLEPRLSRWAIASIVCSVVWVMGIGSVLGIILAAVAFRDIATSAGSRRGRSLAAAAMALGVVGIVLVALAIAVEANLSHI